MIDWRQELIDLRNELADELGWFSIHTPERHRMFERIDARRMRPWFEEEVEGTGVSLEEARAANRARLGNWWPVHRTRWPYFWLGAEAEKTPVDAPRRRPGYLQARALKSKRPGNGLTTVPGQVVCDPLQKESPCRNYTTTPFPSNCLRSPCRCSSKLVADSPGRYRCLPGASVTPATAIVTAELAGLATEGR